MNLACWNRYHCLVLFAASIAFILVHSLLFFIIPAFISFCLLFLYNRKELEKLKPFAGWANRVTALRFLAIVVLSLLYKHCTNAQIGYWLALVIPLDGLDGYIARKRKEQTLMGAYFDMETDVFLVCIASCILFLRDLSGYEILIIGFFRYFYVLIIYLIGFQHLTERRTKIGPVIAVYVFIAVTISFFMSGDLRKLIIYSAIFLLLFSFSYSFFLLLNDRKEVR
jgi:phosphatidylglycerophosphate synthase